MADRAMQEATFLTLTALASGPKHGYAVITDVSAISGGRVELKAGTLYAALDRLRADGLIEVHDEAVVDGRLRRRYRLTATGREQLAAYAVRQQGHARIALQRLSALRPAT